MTSYIAAHIAPLSRTASWVRVARAVPPSSAVPASSACSDLDIPACRPIAYEPHAPPHCARAPAPAPCEVVMNQSLQVRVQGRLALLARLLVRLPFLCGHRSGHAWPGWVGGVYGRVYGLRAPVCVCMYVCVCIRTSLCKSTRALCACSCFVCACVCVCARALCVCACVCVCVCAWRTAFLAATSSLLSSMV
jgi:hypothetical protein